MKNRKEHRQEITRRMHIIRKMLDKHSLDPTLCGVREHGIEFYLGTEHQDTAEVIVKVWELWDEVISVNVYKHNFDSQKKFVVCFHEEELV